QRGGRSPELRQHPTATDRMRSPQTIANLHVRRKSEHPKQRRRQVGCRDRVAVRMTAILVAGAVHLAAANACPGQGAGETVTPVIAARLRVRLDVLQLRRATELAHPDY